jgi:sporulation protein YlmC with PRC-barrel domain
MRFPVSILLLSLLALPALSQTSSTAPSAKSGDNTSNPAVASPSDTSKGVAPAAGANSFTEGQAKSRLEREGFTNVLNMQKDDQGVWRGQATKDGKTVNVAVDYKGDIVTRLTEAWTTTMKTTVSRLYDSRDDALQARTALRASGVDENDISIVANNSEGWYGDDVDRSSNAADGAGKGATVGAVAGGTAGLLAGLGMLAIPGLGPVVAAGWLAATAAGAAGGAAAGAAAGGIIGAMTDSGVPEDEAHVYAEGVRRGGCLVCARVDETQRAKVEAVLARHRPANISERGKTYREAGWNRFDHSAAPYSRDQVATERSRHGTTYANPGKDTTGASIAHDRVKGTEVYNTRGEHLGEVEDVIIDLPSGKVAYAVMSFGGFLGIGEKYHPVPWSLLKYDTARDGYVVPWDKAMLEGAPAYATDQMDYDDRAWNTRVHDYYRAQPYWV